MQSVSPATARAGHGQKTWPSSKRGRSYRSFTATGLFPRQASATSAIAAKRTAAATRASQPLRSANKQAYVDIEAPATSGASILVGVDFAALVACSWKKSATDPKRPT